MDPLSVSGSLAGLIQLGDIVFSRLYRYIKDVKNADKDAKDLKDEIGSLNGVLHNLRLVAQDLENTEGVYNSTSLTIVTSCRETLMKLKKKLEDSGIAGHDNGKFRHAVRKLVWPFKATGIQEIISALRQHRDKLTFALSADSVAVLLKSLGGQKEIAEKVISIEEILRDMRNGEIQTEADKVREKILSYFLFVDPMPSLRTSIEIRHPKTGRWLIEHNVFRRWHCGSAKILWLYGIAGAGKTVLSGLVVEECLRRSEYSQTRATAFFYCNHEDSQSQTLVNILGSLISQLGRRTSSAYSHLQRMYEKTHPREALARNPTATELSEVLVTISEQFEDVRIVVDGLDECSVEGRQITKALHALALSGPSIHLLVLSRDEQYIRESLPDLSCENMEIEAQSDELDLYVRGEIESRRAADRLVLRDTELVDEIAETLVSKARGMFRWVTCQLDYLSDLPTDASRRKALANLPRSLTETYDRVLLRIKKPALPLAQRALRWIAYATPKLSLDELVEILSIEEEDEDLDMNAFPNPKDILRVCGSLVRLSGDTIELAHFTVLEYLETLTTDNEALRDFRLSPESRVVLGESCAKYLSFPTFNEAPLDWSFTFWEREEYAFYNHAARKLPEYLENYESGSVILKYTRQLFDPQKSHNFVQFMLAYSRCQWYLRDVSNLSELLKTICSANFKTLHAAALFRICSICEWLLTNPLDVNHISGLGTALECAVLGFIHTNSRKATFDHLSHSGLGPTMLALLTAGADPNHASTPSRRLGPVAVRGPMDTNGALAILLSKGMFLDEVDVVSLIEFDPKRVPSLLYLLRQLDLRQPVVPPEVWSMLEKAAALQKSPEKVTQVDVRHDLDIQYALKNDDVEKFMDLYRNPEDVFRCLIGNQPTSMLLFDVVQSGAFRILHVLLDGGLNPNMTDKNDQTIMHKRAFLIDCKDVNLFRRLATQKAMDILDRDGRTIWHLTAQYGRADFLEVLLEKHLPQLGPLHDKRYKSTPLLEAIRNRQAKSAILLVSTLDSKVVLDDPRNYHFAVAEGLTEMVEAFFHLGYDPSCVDYRGRNAFFYVTYRTGEDLLNLLLSQGVDPAASDRDGNTPFTYLLSAHERALSLGPLAGKGIMGDLSDIAISIITTKRSLTSKCIDSITPWYLFCTQALSRFAHQQLSDDSIKLLHILLSDGAYESYEQSTRKSGLALLVKQFFGRTRFHLKILIDTMAIGPHTIDHSSDSFLVRLLVWLIGAEEDNPHRHELIEKLLALNICVNTPSPSYGIITNSEGRLQSVATRKAFGGRLVNPDSIPDYYYGCSAVDAAFRWDLSAEILRKLIPKADLGRFTRPEADGTLWFHRLCSRIEYSPTLRPIGFSDPVPKPYYQNNYDKLEVIVQAGVDPNLRSINPARRAAIHVAAACGLLGAVDRLRLIGADLGAVDGSGWGVEPIAAQSGNIELLRYLGDHMDKESWRRTFPITCDGPLGEKPYARCNILHLAALTPIPVETLEWLFRSIFNRTIDCQSSDGLTPLHFAAGSSSPHTLGWLISHWSDIDARFGPEKRTALHIAMEKGKITNAVTLIRAGAGFIPDNSGMTAEMIVHPSGRLDLIEQLLACGMPIPKYVLDNLIHNRRSPKDETYLSHSLGTAEQARSPQAPLGEFDAIVTGNLRYIRNAVHTGTLSERIPECGVCTPIIIALMYRRYAIFDLLLHSQRTAWEQRCCTMHARIPGIYSILNLAVSDPAMNSRLASLLEGLANVGGSSTMNGVLLLNEASPLHVAAAFNPNAISFLLDRASLIYRGHRSALEFHKPHNEVVTFSEALINQPLHCTESSRAQWIGSGGLALHIAAWNKQTDAINALLARGASIHVSCKQGRKPLHYAVLARCASIVRLLLEHGASPRARDSNLRTPLMVACHCGALEVSEILLDAKHDPDMTDIYGQTALHLAAQQNRLQVFIRLMEKGWDPYKKDTKGHSAIFYGLLQPSIATFIFASHFDITTMPRDEIFQLFHTSLLQGSQRIFLHFPHEAHEYLMGPIIDHSLRHAAAAGNSAYLEFWFRLAAKFCILGTSEMKTCPEQDLIKLLDKIRLEEILSLASSVGQLSTVAFLLRHRILQHPSFNAFRSALLAEAVRTSIHSPLLREWLLVGQHIDQRRLTATSSRESETRSCRRSSGIRQVQVPLTGHYAKPKGWSLLDMLHSLVSKDRYSRWLEIFPVDFDTVSHLVETPKELRAAKGMPQNDAFQYLNPMSATATREDDFMPRCGG